MIFKFLDYNMDFYLLVTERDEGMKKLIVLLMAVICLTGCGSDTYEFGSHTVEYGDPIIVEDVVELLLNDGGTREAFCPMNAYDDNSCGYYQDGGAFVLYGEVKNVSSYKYKLNDILKMKVILDSKYEATAEIFLENDDQTEFQLNQFENPITSLMQMDKKNCMLTANFSMEILKNAKEASVEIQVKDDVTESDSDEYTTYVIPLEISH